MKRIATALGVAAIGIGGTVGSAAAAPHSGRDWSQQRCASWLATFEAAHKNTLTRPQALAANRVLAVHSCVIRVVVPPGS
jgi:gas vesicle protein